MKHGLFTTLVLISFLLSACGGSSDSAFYDDINNALSAFRTNDSGVANTSVPGAVANVFTASSGHTIVPQGKANLSTGEDIQSQSVFHLGSISKTFTAAWIMQLDEEGMLSIENTMDTYLSFPRGNEITLRQLLSHTSGITSFTAMSEFASWYKLHPYPTPQEMLEFMRSHPKQSFEPGQGYEYSNSNYYLLGLIGEAVTGKAWVEEVRNRFFNPYHLDSTYVYGYEEGPASPQGYASFDGTTLTEYGSDADYRLGWAAGSVVSSAYDIARWIKLLVAGPVLDEAHRKEMQTVTPQSEAYAKAQGADYYAFTKGTGLCLFEHYTDAAGYGWGHDGQIGGFGNSVAYFAQVDTSFALLTNLVNSDVTKGLHRLVDAAYSPQS